MSDINETYKERWQERRKKSYNWKKLIIMILGLVAIILLMRQLNDFGTKPRPAVETLETSVPQSTDTIADSLGLGAGK